MSGRRIKGFFDGAGTQPAVKIQNGSGFIIGSASPGAAKWLLANNRSGRFVVDIKITGSMPEFFRGQFNSLPVCGNNRTRQCIIGSVNPPDQLFLQIYFHHKHRW